MLQLIDINNACIKLRKEGIWPTYLYLGKEEYNEIMGLSFTFTLTKEGDKLLHEGKIENSLYRFERLRKADILSFGVDLYGNALILRIIKVNKKHYFHVK